MLILAHMVWSDALVPPVHVPGPVLDSADCDVSDSA